MSHRQAVAFYFASLALELLPKCGQRFFDWRKENPVTEEKKPLFKLGLVLVTPGVRNALQEADEDVFTYLFRHAAGDWGSVPPEDANANEEALKNNDRLLSAYFTAQQTKIWVITEWDRSRTTLLLPSEY